MLPHKLSKTQIYPESSSIEWSSIRGADAADEPQILASHALYATDADGKRWYTPRLVPGIQGRSGIFRIETPVEAIPESDPPGGPIYDQPVQERAVFDEAERNEMLEVASFATAGNRRTLDFSIVGEQGRILQLRDDDLFLDVFDLGDGEHLQSLELGPSPGASLLSVVSNQDGDHSYYRLTAQRAADAGEREIGLDGPVQPAAILVLETDARSGMLEQRSRIDFETAGICSGRYRDDQWLLVRSAVNNPFTRWIEPRSAARTIDAADPSLDLIIEVWDHDATDRPAEELRYRGRIASRAWVEGALDAACDAGA